MNSNRRITRSSTDRMIGGVCGGLAAYLDLDPTLVRIAFLLLVFAAGMSPLIYLILWVVLPSDTSTTSSWAGQMQQSLGEMQERATSVAREVSSQVQKISGGANPPSTPPADQSDQGPNTGPTTRF